MSRELSSKKLELAKLYESGDVDLKTFCEQHKVNKSNLYYWRKKLKEKSRDSKHKFVSIQIDSSESVQKMEVHFSTGDKIITNQLLPIAYLKFLLER